MKSGSYYKLFFICFLVKTAVLPLYSQTETFAYAQSDSFFIIRFDKAVDSISAFNPDNYSVDHGIDIKRVVNDANDQRTVVLISDQTLLEGDYNLTISGLSYKDSPGEIIPSFSLRATLDQDPWWNEPEFFREGVSHHSYWSEVHNRLTGYSVYLPESYPQMEDSIPVIYFLGGLGNHENSQYKMWVDIFHSAVQKGEIPPTAIVFPNPMPGSWYVDGKDYLTESMIINELIPLIDSTYRFYTSRKGRWISGFSMGGYGSLYYAFKYPELFSSVVSYSAARNAPVENPDLIRDKLAIRLSVGEVDPYYITTVFPIYNNLQDLGIASQFVGLPGIEHSIYNLFKDIGVEGVKFHWESLGGFNEAPELDAGLDKEIKFEGSASLQLEGEIIDDQYPGSDPQYWWSAVENNNVEITDSSSLNTAVIFNEEGVYSLILRAKDADFLVSDTVTIMVTANPANKAPEIFTGKDSIFTIPASAMEFTAVVNDDGLPAGSELTLNWNIYPSSGAALTGTTNPVSTVTINEPGKYKLRLTASDGEETSADSLFLNVLEENDPFPAVFIPFDEGKGDSVGELIENRDVLPENIIWATEMERTGNFIKMPGHNSHAILKVDAEDPFFHNEINERSIVLQFRLSNNRAATQTLYDEGNLDNGISISKYGGFIRGNISVNGQQTTLRANFNYTQGWQHVAFVVANDKVVLYLNGYKKDEEVINDLPFTPAQEDPVLGASFNSAAHGIAGGEGYYSQFFDGFLDEFAMYNRALTPEQVAKLAGVEYTGVESSGKDRVSIFPNPSADIVNIMLSENYDDLQIRMFDLNGREISKSFSRTGGNIYSVNIINLPSGIYLIKINAKDLHLIRKIIVQ